MSEACSREGRLSGCARMLYSFGAGIGRATAAAYVNPGYSLQDPNCSIRLQPCRARRYARGREHILHGADVGSCRRHDITLDGPVAPDQLPAERRQARRRRRPAAEIEPVPSISSSRRILPGPTRRPPAKSTGSVKARVHGPVSPRAPRRFLSAPAPPRSLAATASRNCSVVSHGWSGRSAAPGPWSSGRLDGVDADALERPAKRSTSGVPSNLPR